MGDDQGDMSPRHNLSLRQLPRIVLEGFIGNAVWALLVLVAVVSAAFLEGSVSAWLFSVVLVVSLAVAAFVATALTRRAERMRGARDEARQQAADAIQRAVEIEERTEIEKRELREQLATATGGEQAVSTRMQSIARQVDALSSAPIGAGGPGGNQVDLLVALLEDFEQKAPHGDPVLKRLLASWRDSRTGHSASAWHSALGVLKARALSIGAEEALGQQ